MKKIINRNTFLKKLSIISAACIIHPIECISDNQDNDITIMHTNDFHSHIDPFPLNHDKYAGLGGISKRSSLINIIRNNKKNTLLLDAGDIIQGTPYFNYFGGNLEFKLMNLLKYDCITLGNHDFDNGLTKLKELIKLAKFDTVISNYKFNDLNIDDEILKYKIFYKGNFKIGVFGLGIKLHGLVNKNLYGNTKYINPLESAYKISKFLRFNKKCNLIICLSHLGYSYNSNKISDIKLAKNNNYIDLIIGGHTHTLLDKPTLVKDVNNNKKYIFQAGWGGLYLGKIDLTLTRDGLKFLNKFSIINV